MRNAAANGHETLDTDSSAVAEEKGDLACERYVLDNDKLQVEVLANLDKVQPAGAVVIVSYPRIEGGNWSACTGLGYYRIRAEKWENVLSPCHQRHAA